MSTDDIVKLITAIVSCLVPLIGFITALVKLFKNKQWNILKSALCDFMIKAEEMKGATGEEKKQAVLKWCEEFCKQNHINFDVNHVSAAIETLINLTKKVNYKKEEIDVDVSYKQQSV